MSDNMGGPVLYDAVCKISSSSTKEFNYKLIIDNLQNVINDYPNGQQLKCEEFKIPMKYSALPCYISIYPSGKREKYIGSVSLFLHAEPSDNMKCKLKYECGIVDAEGEAKSLSDTYYEDVSRYKGGWGDYEVITHNDLFDASKKYLKNGSLTLAFKISIQQDGVVSNSKQFDGNEGVSKDHFNFMRKLLENPEDFGSDFIIECSDHEEVKCHTNIIAANSEVFKAMLSHDSTEKEAGRVEMDDLKMEICKNILKFVYTGYLDEDDITMELYEQSDKLGFLVLKDVCSKHLMQCIDKENCIGTLLVADARDDQGLMDAAIECILDNYAQLADMLKNNVNNHKILHEMLDKMAQRIKLA